MSQIATLETIHTNLQAELMQRGISALLPAHVTPEQFTRTAATALVVDPELQNADRQSLLLALTRCARDGLMPDGREAAMVVRSTKNRTTGVFDKKAVYMPMVDGVLKRARQSGQVANIIAKAVFEADQFDYWIDEHGEHLNHRPAFSEKGDVKLVYALAKLTSGEIVAEVMTRGEVEKVRDTVKSAAYASSPWMQWFDRMALKTVLHRLARRLPCASEMYALFDASSDNQDAGLEGVVNAAMTPPGKPRNLMEAIAVKLQRERRARQSEPEPAQEVEVVESAAVLEQEPEHPEFEALLNALGDVTDVQSYTEVADRCTIVAKTLSEGRREVLRGAARKCKARIDSDARRLL